jgi:threonyl-tRNA synthetase
MRPTLHLLATSLISSLMAISASVLAQSGNSQALSPAELGRINSNQVDFAQAERFDLSFTNEKNEKERPLIIHRAPLATHERFIGFLLEHYAGKFPLWLAPEQIAILPISDKYLDYAKEVQLQLQTKGFSVTVDSRSEKTGRKIRDTEIRKVPYMLVVGENESTDRTVAVRKQGKGDQGVIPLDTFVEDVLREVAAFE